MQTILSAVIVLGILIFVHELGHFLFAKLFGVRVEKFSLGFGPKLLGRKIGETEYLVSAFPLGGYVKMTGEGGDDGVPEGDHERSFAEKHPFQRMVIVAAGPLFNLFFALLLFIVVFMLGVPTPTSRIGNVVKNKPAIRAGLKPNDIVTSINGKQIRKWTDLSREIQAGGGRPVDMVVKRGTSTLAFRVMPEVASYKNLLGDTVTSPLIGVEVSNEVVTERFGPVQSVIKGGQQTWNVVKLTVVSLGKIVSRAIPMDNIGGPIMIAKMAGQQASEGVVNFLAFMALLSVNLGILNLLPVPILDGGHLAFYATEMLTGRPVSLKVREIAQQFGLVLLVGLMVLAFYNDIMRYVVGQG
jgi:regulator of sigma E protease